MFEQLKRICKNTKKLDSDKILKKIFANSDVKKFVADLQKSQMYDESVDSKGKPLGDYSEASVKVFGKEPGKIKVYETGKFYNSIKVVSEQTEVIIRANTIKVAWDGAIDLLDRWPDLLGLDQNNLSLVREYIKPIFIDLCKQQIFA